MNSEKILNLILSDIYNCPTEDEILVIKEVRDKLGNVGYNLIVAGQALPENRLKEMIECAKALQENELFHFIVKELEYHGAKRMAVNASDWDGVRFPKAFLYAAQLLKTKVKQLKDLQIPKKVAKNKKDNE